MKKLTTTIEKCWANTVAYFDHYKDGVLYPEYIVFYYAAFTKTPMAYSHVIRLFSLMTGAIISYNPHDIYSGLIVTGTEDQQKAFIDLLKQTMELCNPINTRTARMAKIIHTIKVCIGDSTEEQVGNTIMKMKRIYNDYPKYSPRPTYTIYRFYVY